MYKFGSKFIDESSVASIEKITLEIPYRKRVKPASLFSSGLQTEYEDTEVILVKLKNDAVLGDFFHPISKYCFYQDTDGSQKEKIESFRKKADEDMKNVSSQHAPETAFSKLYPKYVYGTEWHSVAQSLDDILDKL